MYDIMYEAIHDLIDGMIQLYHMNYHNKQHDIINNNVIHRGSWVLLHITYNPIKTSLVGVGKWMKTRQLY
jgi:hypothetical protein